MLGVMSWSGFGSGRGGGVVAAAAVTAGRGG